MTTQPALLSQLAIVLVRPKYSGNIGASARIAWNMGVNRLIIVGDRLPEREPMAQMATHKAAHLIDNLEFHTTLEEALSPYSVIVGTTARRGRQRIIEKSPREIVETVLPQLSNNRVALIFGPEDSGLTNEDLKHCHLLSAIPTADFSSLNLAQAVAIHCYEFYYGLVHSQKDMMPAPRLASSFELESMYSHLEESLTRIEFMGEKSRIYWMNNIRHFFAQTTLSSKDTNIIRKVCKKFLLNYNPQDTNPNKSEF
ncbi:MAG: tRNA methyltransferase [Desulfobulbaceae bacterium S3730MH12]|nr:MAG: tRNA methyltransferase [Desulfobulbaceae bacterium S5133MH15]OEU58209.1 MAG: tRNA methyltransferase [Desulfobulbaceae bacterium S3730MH12]OEU81780.1 MAG: tRNA methyltransferase [Desulfobulbaceae bacterium C00003063]